MIALASLAAAAGPTAAQAWDALLAAGCDASTVHSPLEARVLRNVPYARGGHTFRDAGLAGFFRDDGGWYAPSGAKVALEGPALACRGGRGVRRVLRPLPGRRGHLPDGGRRMIARPGWTIH